MRQWWLRTVEISRNKVGCLPHLVWRVVYTSSFRMWQLLFVTGIEANTPAFQQIYLWYKNWPISFICTRKSECADKNFSCWRGLIRIKALVNEDTLLPMMFLGLRKLGNTCCGHKIFLNKIKNIFCVPDTKFVSASNVTRAGKRGNICVGNNVSAIMCPRLPGPLPSVLHYHATWLA